MSESYRLIDLLRELRSIKMELQRNYPNHQEFVARLLEVTLLPGPNDEISIRQTILHYLGKNADKVLDAKIEYASILKKAKKASTKWSQYNSQGPVK